MSKTNVVQNNFLSGVLDPRAKARVDTESYNNGLLVGKNILPHHLGGVRRRPGLKYHATLPNQLTRIVSGVTIAAPNGGTTASANDNSQSTLLTTTTLVGTNNPYVVVHYDLGSSKTVLFADVYDIYSDGGSSTEFQIQYSTDDAAWTTLGDAFEVVDTQARSYRRSGPTLARYWRVVKIGGTNMGSVHISLAEFNLWQDSGTISEGRLFAWEVSTEDRFILALTDRSATIFEDGVAVAFLPSPYVSTDLAEIDVATNAESLLAVHENYPPRFFIQELSEEFQTFPAIFDSIPQVDFADTSSPTPTSDVQVITFASGFVEGDTFQIQLEGSKTGPVTYAGDNATTAANIAREVQKLWVVKAFTGVSCARTGTREFTITLAAASAAPYEKMSVTALSSSATASVNHTVTGVARSEPLWSATRGYPRSTAFFEGRLYFGGTKSRQQSIIGSEVNNILALEVGEGLDDDPVFVTLNGAQLNAIQGVFSGRSLQLFTSGGEFRYVKEQGAPITPGDAPVNQTQYGAARVRPVTIDGATVFVQRNRKSIRDFRFDYTENAYNSLGVSSLAAHLIYDVKDLAAWNGSAIDEIGLVFVVNGTNSAFDDALGPSTYTDEDTGELVFRHGTMAVLNTRKEANVQAWTIWETLGEFKSVATVLQDIFVLVKRSINDVDTLFLEETDFDYYTDCAKKVTNMSPSTSVTGFGHLEAEECRVRADGFVLESVTPSAGNATLQQASTNVEIGLDWELKVTPMPLQSMTPTGSNLMRKKRVVKARVNVRNALGLRMNGRALADRFWDQDNFDTPAAPFTGVHELEETTNWDQQEDKLVSFTQNDPLPCEILSLDVQMESSE